MLLSMFSINKLSRTCLFVSFSRSFLIIWLRKILRFRKKSILDKNFEIILWPSIFEIYVQRVFSKKQYFRKILCFEQKIIEIMSQRIISKNFTKIAKDWVLEKNSYTRIFRIWSLTYVSFAIIISNDSGLS